MHSDLGKNVLITGANRGLGLAMVGEIAKNYNVDRIFACCREPTRAKDLIEVKKKYPIVNIIKLDIQNDTTIKAAVEEVKKILGHEHLNVLINNAAIFENSLDEKSDGSFETPDRGYFNRHFDVNITGLTMVSGAFLPLLKKAAAAKERALLINLSSTLGSINVALACQTLTNKNIAYCLTKAAVNHYTHMVGTYLEGTGVIVACFCPGWVKTDMGTEIAELTIDESIPHLIKTISNLTKEKNGGYYTRHGEVIPW